MIEFYQEWIGGEHMDIFMEKIVRKKKDFKDYLITAAIVIAAVILILVVLTYLSSMGFIITVGIIYMAYLLITTRNVEYEYAVTNGDLDIDKIIAQRKRVRIFSENCKNFEIVAKLKSDHFTPQYRSFKGQIDCTSTREADGVWFIALNYKNEQTIVYFEPTEKMLQNFKTFIPRKVFTD
jgi:hypothetical protein